MSEKLENEDNTVMALSMFQIFMEGGYLLVFIQILCQLNYFILEHDVFSQRSCIALTCVQLYQLAIIALVIHIKIYCPFPYSCKET